VARSSWNGPVKREGYDISVQYGASTGSAGPVQPATKPTAEGTPKEFKQFEDLASKLVQVPKTELDEKRR
jgi:hypothetical protein